MSSRACFYDDANPVQNTIVQGTQGQHTYAYSLAEVEAIRMAWEDYRDGAIYVSRSIVNGRVGETKTKAPNAPIPVIPRLTRILDARRLRNGNPTNGPMFRALNGAPIILDNIRSRVILPAIWNGTDGTPFGEA